MDFRLPALGEGIDSATVVGVRVKPGDAVKKEDSLVTLESDKATMEVPSTHAGVVKEVRVKLGDKVAQGTVIATLEASDAAKPTAPTAQASPRTEPASAAAPAAG